VLLNFFIIHIFFSHILWSDCCHHHVVIKFSSYSSSYRTCHHTSSSVNFFFLLSSLLLQCCYTHSWCYEVVMVTCVDPLACVPSRNFVSKKSSRTFVIPARTSLCSHAPAFMSLTCGISLSCEYAAHIGSQNASHIATLALDVPFPCRFVYLNNVRQVPPHAIAS
jgi:hypothetical protein